MAGWLSTAMAVLVTAAATIGSGPSKTSGLPEPGKAVGVAITDTPGRWLVIRAEPFEIVTDLKTVHGSTENYVIWQGTAGKYTAVLIPSDQAAPLEFAAVTLGGGGPGPNPDPNPNPDPKPPPGPRQVTVIEEKDERTAAVALVQQKVQEYCTQAGHTWSLVDDDTVDQTGRQPERVRFFLGEMQKAGIKTPAIIVSVNWQGKEHFGIGPLPATPDAAIKIIQQYGG